MLWEMLSVEVMDTVIKLHHTTIRKQLLQHSGYESATEVRAPPVSEALHTTKACKPWPARLSTCHHASCLLPTLQPPTAGFTCFALLTA